MKKICILIALLASAIVQAQTAGKNWTATDCNGGNHTLYDDLDKGKVVVMVWVMPCDYCTPGTKAVLDAVQSYNTSNPGKVLLYLIDDFGNSNCISLSAWLKGNNINANITMFDNAGYVINQDDFGGSGMPHITVVAGAGRKIYYNEWNAATNNVTAIKQGIFDAIGGLGISENTQQQSFSIYPNPVTGILTIASVVPVKIVTIISLTGAEVKRETYINGRTNPTINMDGIANGTYLVGITDVDGHYHINLHKVIKH
jgi:hypothetical protein